MDYEQIANSLDGLARDMRDMGDSGEDAEALIAAAKVLRRLCGQRDARAPGAFCSRVESLDVA